MFQILGSVSVNGEKNGMAFGGHIFGASCDIGFSNGPSKITLNIVSESGIYKTISPNVYSSPYNINLNGQVFSGMYLYEYEKTKSPDAHLLTVSFLDSSIVLDKIYIGLLNRHGNQQRETNLITGAFTVRCPSCENGLMTNVNGTAQRYLDSIPGGCYYQKTSDGGGFIILGKEGFTESNCEIPKVDYNFTEFCDAITRFGIKHELGSFDLNTLYRQEYVGTLREVLNNWASDFSFEFFYDGTTLKAINLRRPINLNAIQDFAESNEYVTSMSYNESLQNTYSQSVVARYLKPSSAQEYNNTFHFKKLASPISLADILKNRKCASRSGEVLLTSIALARLDNSLREYYIANKAFENDDLSILESLGFIRDAANNLPGLLGPTDVTTLLNSLSNSQNELAKGYSLDSDDYYGFVGLFKEDAKEAVQRWDNEAAEFIGKYYRFADSLPQDSFDCPFFTDWFKYYNYHSQWSTTPESNTYGGNAVPFASLLKDPLSGTDFVSFVSPRICAIEDNCWGIEASEYETQRAAINYDFFKPIIIPFEDMPIPSQMGVELMRQLAPTGTISNSSYVLTNAAETLGAKAVFCLVPKATIAASPKISNLCYRTVNRAVYKRMSTRTNDDQKAAECNTYCDSNIVSELCSCGSQYTPIPYFQNLYAPYIQIAHSNGNISKVVFPVDSNYWGYFTQNRYFKTTYPPIKAIYGTPPNSPSNSLSSRVVDYDITPDLDAVMDENEATNQYLYSPTNGEIMTAQGYYDELANLNNLVVPAQKTINITIANTNLVSLGIPLVPASGLTAMSISITDGSVQTNLTYSTRPPVIPKPEAIFSKIKYRLNR